MQYFSDPTDAVPYEAENWLADIAVFDSTSESDFETSSGVELLTLYGLDVSPNIDYGSLYADEDTQNVNSTTTVVNTGNSNIDIKLSGSNMTGGVSTIAVGEQKYATSTFTYSACAICQFLTGSAEDFEVDLPKPTSTSTPITDDVYWGLNVPVGSGAVTHTGINTFIATSD
jgi:hypothetical protein